MSGEKTEKASEQRKRKSREGGEGVRSRELTGAAAMLGGLLLLRSACSAFTKQWTATYAAALESGSRSYSTSDGMARAISQMLLPGTLPVAAVMLAALVGAVAVGAAQTGGLQVHPAALALKFGRLSPGENIKSMFSMRSLLRVCKSLLPAAAVVMLGIAALHALVLPVAVTSMARLPLTLNAAYELAIEAAWISTGWAGLDYLMEWRAWNQGIKMSKDDLRQEMKESNGNPQTKGRLRQIQRAMRKRRVKADVARAAVVITNPTHYAVALLFDVNNMAAPRVLTKGRDLHALEIREQARWSGVPIVENPPLARSLYRSVEEGQAIPFELYTAVAAILAFLFRQSAAKAETVKSYGYAAPPRTIIPNLSYDDIGGSAHHG